MREKRYFLGKMRKFVGITPAYAGKTLRTLLRRRVCEDHPRVCGKNMQKFEVFSDDEGSPPRMREKLVSVFVVVNGIRDHPRVCGKNCISLDLLRSALGSPPRMREKPILW